MTTSQPSAQRWIGLAAGGCSRPCAGGQKRPACHRGNAVDEISPRNAAIHAEFAIALDLLYLGVRTGAEDIYTVAIIGDSNGQESRLLVDNKAKQSCFFNTLQANRRFRPIDETKL